MTIQQMIELLEAYKAGKPLQWRPIGTDRWNDASHHPSFSHDYRVKPGPREWEGWIDADGLFHASNVVKTIRVREVMG